MESMLLKGDYVVQKRNILNEMKSNNMTLQELRIFSVYLARINAWNVETRVVRFSLAEFQRIMEIGRIQEKDIKDTVGRLLGKHIFLPNASGKGFTGVQLFKYCRLDQDENGKWYIEIDAHDDALPLMFEFKDKYFSYDLWNALKLKSVNQLRMYELMKQYEHAGERTVELDNLREWLGIEPHEYQRWERLKARVIDVCQRAIEKHTDIKITYELIRKGVGRGTGRKITHIRFLIEKNDKYVDQLNLADYIGEEAGDVCDIEISGAQEFYAEQTADIRQQTTDFRGQISEDGQQISDGSGTLKILAEACGGEFSQKELQKIEQAADKAGIDLSEDGGFLKQVYERYGARKINSPAGKVKYFIKVMETAAAEKAETSQKTDEKKRNRFANFKPRKRDFAEIERLEMEYLQNSVSENR